MKQRALFCTFLFLLLLVNACKEATKQPPPVSIDKERRPNIVLIVTDDQGWGDLSRNGNKNLQTPNVDALAAQGVSFENFYVQPVCSPTRAELLTGRYFLRTGVYETSAGGERINTDETTLADLLKREGYRTAAYGKWHSGMQPPYHPNSRGFDDFYGFASGHWGNYFSPMLEHNGRLVKGKGFLPDDLTDKGLAFIEKHQEDPFFLYLPYNTPHSPMQVPDEYWNRFKDVDLESTYEGEEEEDINFTKAALAMVENIDTNVGRITNKLKELALEENTIVVFLSDNGPNGWRYNGGMRGKKGATDEGGVRSPFFIQWKGVIPAGKSVSQIASSIDLLPTLSELVSLDPKTNKPIDGKSLHPLINGTAKNWPPRLLFNHWNGKTSVRSQQYRLDHENRLYHIFKERGQQTDVSEHVPKMTDSLKRAKTAWLASMNPLSAESDTRAFTLGHPEATYTQLPARDGIPYGNIKRSNRWPNDSYFTHWKSIKDSISWDIEVLEKGNFEVTLYYACKAENAGVGLMLTHGKSMLGTRLREAHDPPLIGAENDRVPRGESYVKAFKAFHMGTIPLNKGRHPMTLKALAFSGKEAIEVRLLQFKRVD